MTTWDPSGKDASIALSNGNMTATGSTSGYRNVRGTTSKTSGKVHIEFFLNASLHDETTLGLATSTETLIDYLGIAGNQSLGFYVHYGPANRVLYFGDANVAPATAQASWFTGVVITLEIDFDAGLLWCTAGSDDWNKNAAADPSAGTGGLNISAVVASGPLYPAFGSMVSGDQCTLRTEASDFTRAVSSGFVAWDFTPAFNPELINPNADQLLPYKLRTGSLAGIR